MVVSRRANTCMARATFLNAVIFSEDVTNKPPWQWVIAHSRVGLLLTCWPPAPVWSRIVSIRMSHPSGFHNVDVLSASRQHRHLSQPTYGCGAPDWFWRTRCTRCTPDVKISNAANTVPLPRDTWRMMLLVAAGFTLSLADRPSTPPATR